LKKCGKSNKGRHILSAAEMFNMDSSFWLHMAYVYIRGGSHIFMKIFLRFTFYIRMRSYIYESLAILHITKSIAILRYRKFQIRYHIKGQAVPKNSVDCRN